MSILRLFSSYRKLEDALRDADEDRLELHGQVRALTIEVERARADANRAAEQERKTYQVMLNVEYQRRLQFTPFPEVPSLPDRLMESMQPSVEESGIVNGRSVVEQELRRTRGLILDLYEGQGEKP